jgi:hypothetical protein
MQALISLFKHGSKKNLSKGILVKFILETFIVKTRIDFFFKVRFAVGVLDMLAVGVLTTTSIGSRLINKGC